LRGKPRTALQAGRYLYCGSAEGSGGIRARLSRHMRPGKVIHWHVDLLTAAGRVTGAWIFSGRDECELVWALSRLPAPIRGFGSTDCPKFAELATASGPNNQWPGVFPRRYSPSLKRIVWAANTATIPEERYTPRRSIVSLGLTLWISSAIRPPPPPARPALSVFHNFFGGLQRRPEESECPPQPRSEVCARTRPSRPDRRARRTRLQTRAPPGHAREMPVPQAQMGT
jgi:Uri superfamily endonuclease